MKTLGIFLFSVVFTLNNFAQESEFTKMMRQVYQEEFIAVVNENMNLTQEQNEVFQPIFDEFVADLRPVMDNKLNNQGKFSEYFDNMTDEHINEIMKNIWKNKKDYDKVVKKYTKKISKEINTQSGFRFFLIVRKITSNFEFSIIQNIPLVEN